MIRVLFVCLGNICRSPMAEAVLRHKVEEAGLSHHIQVDSAGTGDYHIGEPPHSGTRRKLEEMGVSWEGIKARQVKLQDFGTFTYVIAMDEENLRNLRRLSGGDHQEKIRLLSSFAEDSRFDCGVHVPDPWYTGDFQQTYDLVSLGCSRLLDYLKTQL